MIFLVSFRYEIEKLKELNMEIEDFFFLLLLSFVSTERAHREEESRR